MRGRGNDSLFDDEIVIAGFYAGFLASAYHLGSFLGNPVVCIQIVN